MTAESSGTATEPYRVFFFPKWKGIPRRIRKIIEQKISLDKFNHPQFKGKRISLKQSFLLLSNNLAVAYSVF